MRAHKRNNRAAGGRDKLDAIVVYGVSDFAVPDIFAALTGVGIRPIFIYKKEDYETQTLHDLLCAEAIEYKDSAEVSVIIGRLATYFRIVAIVPLKDEFVAASIRLAEEFGVRGISPGCATAIDKGTFSRLFPELTPETFELSKTDLCEALHIIKTWGRNAILKPAFGTDSAGVTEYKQGQTDVSEFVGRESYILQQKLVGRNIFIDGAVLGDEYVFWGIGEVDRSYLATETQYNWPVPDLVSSSTYEKVINSIKTICKRLNITRSTFHIQCILTDVGVRIIDPNFGRIGGNAVSFLLAKTLGLSHVEFWEAYFGLFLDNKIDYRLKGKLNMKQWSAINFGVERDSMVMAVTTHGLVAERTLTIQRLPARVTSLANGNCGWMFTVVCPRDEVAVAASRIMLETTSGAISPVY